MSYPDTSPAPVNGLLASIARIDRDYVTGACEHIDLIYGDEVCRSGDRIRHVYFPTDSYISMIAPAGASENLEVGMVGSEGMFGITVLLDVRTSALAGIVQGSGPALRMSAARFGKIANERASFRRILNRYLYVLTAQLAQTRGLQPVPSPRCTHGVLAPDDAGSCARPDVPPDPQIPRLHARRPARGRDRGGGPAADAGPDPICARGAHHPQSSRARSGFVRVLRRPPGNLSATHGQVEEHDGA